jgi:hypothetical protein
VYGKLYVRGSHARAVQAVHMTAIVLLDLECNCFHDNIIVSSNQKLPVNNTQIKLTHRNCKSLETRIYIYC